MLGILLDEVGGATHAIDFLHPRKKPEPVNTRRRNLLIGATLAVMGLAAVLLVMIQLESIDGEIMQLRSQLGSMKAKVATAEKQKQNTAAVQEFVDSDFNWLDELRSLSQQLPPADDVLITQLNAGTRMPSGGEISLDGFTRNSELTKDVYQRLRANNRKVIEGKGGEETRREKEKLRWRLDQTVIVEPATHTPPPESPSPQSAANPLTAKNKSGSTAK